MRLFGVSRIYTHQYYYYNNIIQLKSICFRFQIQNPHTCNQYYSQDIFISDFMQHKSGTKFTEFVANLATSSTVLTVFFWLNYGASKQLWCIQTSSVTYKYISRKKEIKMVRQTMTEKERFTNSTFWLCETQ